MKYKETDIPGCFEIEPKIMYDHRGEYVDTFNLRDYKLAFGVDFVEDDVSISRKNVLRGLHGDNKTWKLIQCLHGSIILAVVDCLDELKFSHLVFHLKQLSYFR